MADLIDRLRAKAGLSIAPHAPHLMPGRVYVYDADMRDLLTEAADALAARAQGGDAVAYDREAEVRQYPDAAFNAWLDTGITDCGHTVRDTIRHVGDAWAGWDNRGHHDGAEFRQYEAAQRASDAALSTPQPDAVRALPAKWRLRVALRKHFAEDWHKGYKAGLNACANNLDEALSAQGAAGAGEER